MYIDEIVLDFQQKFQIYVYVIFTIVISPAPIKELYLLKKNGEAWKILTVVCIQR